MPLVDSDAETMFSSGLITRERYNETNSSVNLTYSDALAVYVNVAANMGFSYDEMASILPNVTAEQLSALHMRDNTI